MITHKPLSTIQLPDGVDADRSPSRGGAFYLPEVLPRNESLSLAWSLIQDRQRHGVAAALSVVPALAAAERDGLIIEVKKLDDLGRSVFHSFSQLGLLWPGRIDPNDAPRTLDELHGLVRDEVRAHAEREISYAGAASPGRELRSGIRERFLQENLRALNAFEAQAEHLNRLPPGTASARLELEAAPSKEVLCMLHAHGAIAPGTGETLIARNKHGQIAGAAIFADTQRRMTDDPQLFREYGRLGELTVLGAFAASDEDALALLSDGLRAVRPSAAAAVHRGPCDRVLPLADWLRDGLPTLVQTCETLSVEQCAALATISEIERRSEQAAIAAAQCGEPSGRSRRISEAAAGLTEERRALARMQLQVIHRGAALAPDAFDGYLGSGPAVASAISVVYGGQLDDAAQLQLAQELCDLTNANRYYPLDLKSGEHGTVPATLDERFFLDFIRRGGRVVEHRAAGGARDGYVMVSDSVTTAELRPEVVERYAPYGSVGYLPFVAVRPGAAGVYAQLMSVLPLLSRTPDLFVGRTLEQNARGLLTHLSTGNAVLNPADFAILRSDLRPDQDQQYIELNYSVALGTMVPLSARWREEFQRLRLPRRELAQLVGDVSIHAFGGVFARPEEAALHQLGIIHGRRDFYECVLTAGLDRILEVYAVPTREVIDPDARCDSRRSVMSGYREPTLREQLRICLPSHVVDDLERDGFFDRLKRGAHDERSAAGFRERVNRYAAVRDPQRMHDERSEVWDSIDRFARFLEFQFGADEDLGPTAEFTTTGSWAAECNRRGGFRHPEVTFSSFSGLADTASDKVEAKRTR